MAGRRGLDRGLVGMCIAMAGLAMTFTLSTPVVWLQVDRFIHVPNIATLVSQAFVLIYTAGQEIMLLYWLYPLEKSAATRASTRHRARVDHSDHDDAVPDRRNRRQAGG